MSHQSFELELIVPIRYNGSHYADLGTEKCPELYQYFEQKDMKCNMINVQNDGIWNNDQGGIMKYLEVRQAYREMLGLYKSSQYRYYFKNCNKVRFKITKAGVWFLREGNAYITLHIAAGALENTQVLDLKNLLVTVRNDNNKILYEAAPPVGVKKEAELTLKNLIGTCIRMLGNAEPTEVQNTYDTALSLSYGIENRSGEKELKIYCENIRKNLKSEEQILTGVNAENCFIPEKYPYLYWSISENSVNLTADIDAAFTRSENSGNYVEHQLGQSIFKNYLMLYLYYCSLQERCTELESQCRKADKALCMYSGKKAVQNLENDITEVVDKGRFSHVNKLFYHYLCGNVWTLTIRLEKLKAKTETAALSGMPNEYEIFISYRRRYGAYVTRLVYNELINEKKRVFYDIPSMRSGNYVKQIEEVIPKSKYIIAVLTPGSLDKRNDPDMMRKELELAFENKKKIIPLMVDGFEFNDQVMDGLPEKLQKISDQHGIHIDGLNIDSALQSLISLLSEEEA